MLPLGLEAKTDEAAGAPPRPSFDLIPGLGAAEIDRELRLADRQTDVGTRRLAFYLADMETRGICQLLGYATATVYAIRRLEMGKRHAQQLIAAGRALEELPQIDQAFCDGRLNWSRVRLLTKIAVRETDAAWLERALKSSWADFHREVLTSEKGRPPRADRKGLPQVRIGVAAKLDRLGYEQWELAKQKLSDERGEPATDADMMACAARLLLSTRTDGTIPGRTRLDDSIYRIVVERCSDCESTYLQTAEGKAELRTSTFEAIACDGKVEVIEDVEPGQQGKAPAASKPASGDPPKHAPPTPAWMRAKVLVRDGYACCICGCKRDVQAHHVTWRSLFGRTKPSNIATLCTLCHGLVHENLLFVGGEAPHRLTVTGRDGTPLARDPSAIGPMVRSLRPVAAIAETPAEGIAHPLPEVTFATLPRAVEAAWWSRHAHLFTPSAERGEMAFEPGSAIEPAPPTEEQGLPATEGQSERPWDLDSLIGQERVVETLRDAVTAARVRQKPLDHALFLGEAGLGKTTIARALAHEMGARLSITSGPLVKDASVLVKTLTALERDAVLFIDEIHGLPRPVAEILYEAMEDQVLRLQVTDGHRTKSIEIALHPFTLIGATTELGKVPKPLQTRFTVREYLESYGEDELTGMVTRAAARDRLEIEEKAALVVARRAHGVPREALKLSKRIQDLALARGAGTIDEAFVRAALRRFGIDERGLGVVERKALGVLERHGRGRPMGISRWSAASGIESGVLRQVCEPTLSRLGLISVTPRGRMAVW